MKISHSSLEITNLGGSSCCQHYFSHMTAAAGCPETTLSQSSGYNFTADIACMALKWHFNQVLVA